MKNVVRFLVSILAAFLIPACIGDKDKDKTPWESTPDGFIVYWYDKGTLSSQPPLSDKATLYAEFDAAISIAAGQMLTTYGLPEANFYAAARVHRFRLHDNIFFYYSGQRVFGYHEDSNDFNEIGVAYWPFLTDPTAPDPTAPEWTHYYSNISNLWYWGVHDAAKLYAVLRHEVGHHIYGALFEHKAGPLGALCPGCKVDF